MNKIIMAGATKLVLIVAVLIIAIPATGNAGHIKVTITNEKDGTPVPGSVVFVKREGMKKSFSSTKTIVVDQIDKEFVPHVTVVTMNTPVTFPNSDDIRHHVYSLSKPKNFELPLYTGTPANPVIFDKPGVVSLGCNIHDWMSAYIFVVDTPYFAKSDINGIGIVTGLPEGEYLVKVWNPRMRGSSNKTEQKVYVEGGFAQVEQKLKLRKVWKPRRAPTMGGGGYR